MRNRHATAEPEAGDIKPPSLAAIGALIGDPVRAAVLSLLTDGSRRPAGELAFMAGASPQAISAHLAQLVDGGLLSVEKQGRYRFFRIASGEVAEMIEGLANWTDRQPRRRRLDPALCKARVCYDHLAGEVGVAVFDCMAAQGWIAFGAGGPGLSPAGLEWCRRNQVDPAGPARSHRPLLRLCLDWTERRNHLGGHLGAALAHMLLRQGYARCRPGERIVDVTPGGVEFLRRELSIELRAVAGPAQSCAAYCAPRPLRHDCD